jgi:hypothetical protein
MDLFEAIQKLYAQKASLMRAISALEALQSPASRTSEPGRSKRGRKSMNPEERQQVSMRMKKYWAQRRVSNMDDGRS